MSDKNKKRPSIGTPSICEEALEGYRSAEDTFAGLIEKNHIEVRDFMVLSFVCDQHGMTADRISSALGLSRESTLSCIERLRKTELVSFEIDHNSGSIVGAIVPTAVGKSIAARIHSTGND